MKSKKLYTYRVESDSELAHKTHNLTKINDIKNYFSDKAKENENKLINISALSTTSAIIAIVTAASTGTALLINSTNPEIVNNAVVAGTAVGCMASAATNVVSKIIEHITKKQQIVLDNVAKYAKDIEEDVYTLHKARNNVRSNKDYEQIKKIIMPKTRRYVGLNGLTEEEKPTDNEMTFGDE